MSRESESNGQASSEGCGSATAPLPPAEKKEPRSSKRKPAPLPPYHVVLLDDQDHTHEYVVEMMRALFGYPAEHGYLIAEQVNTQMKAIVYTTHKELAELKRDQIHAFGADARVPSCAGSMSAVIVPAEA
jgi:ATP-dependent Clp protease adaptor protein ClpS